MVVMITIYNYISVSAASCFSVRSLFAYKSRGLTSRSLLRRPNLPPPHLQPNDRCRRSRLAQD